MQMSSCEGCDAEKFSSPMPWIGRYIVAASLLCILAMLLDTIHGFRHRKFWLPCRFFKLNAVSLTLLAVAMKLPMDLNNPMPGEIDQLAKLSSNVFMSAAMVNFMPSLGLMGERDILMNMAALGILVITLVVNVCVELETGVIYSAKVENILVLVFMVFLFVILSFSGLAVPKIKQDLELQFFEMKRMTGKTESDDLEKSGLCKLEEDLKKYWVMAESGNPQFVMARSVTCSAACAICCLNFVILLEGLIRNNFFRVHIKPGSDYRRSTICIARIQSIGVALGTISSLIRWLATTRLKWGKRNDRRCKSKIKVEKYWIEGLTEWKRSLVALQFKNHRIGKLAHKTKNLFVNICIGVQIFIIAIGKLAKHISVILSKLFSLCSCSCSENKGGSRSEAKDLDLSQYVLHLEDEEELPQMMANKSSAICEMIETGRKLQPRILMELLLQGSKDFNGLAMLDSNCVLDPHARDELPSCWKMLLVTLTSIAVANPKIDQEMVKHLLCGVSQGLKYVNLIEEVLGAKEDLRKIRSAADVVWLDVFLFRRWLDNDLHKMAVDGKTSKEIVQKLAASAKDYIVKLKTKGNLKDGCYLKWPAKLIAATSMNHISRSILDFESKNEQTDEEFFGNISVMIADVLAACFANMPRVMLMKCFSVPIEKREASVLEAAFLFGETEKILRFLQQHEHPSLAPEKMVYIEEWCRSIKQKHLSVPSSSQDDLQIVTK